MKIRSQELAVLLGCFCLSSSMACEDEGENSPGGGVLDAASGSQSPDGAGANPDGRLDAEADAAVAMVDAMGDVAAPEPDTAWNVPEVDAGAGCSLLPSSPLSPAQAGLPGDGLMLWLRADRGVYAAAGGAVCAWADHSGRGHLFNSAGPNARPLHVPGQPGEVPAIRFTGAGKGLAVAGVLVIAAQSARTLVAVQKLITPAARFASIMQGQSGTSGTYVNIDTNPFQTVGNREGVYVTNNAYDSSLATGTDWRAHAFLVGPMTVATPVLPAIRYRINGAALTLTRTPGGLGNTNFENFSGANFTAVGVGTAGSDVLLAEVLVYDRVLSAPDLAAVEAALAQRYKTVNPLP